MPIYEYKCIKCGKILEQFVKMSSKIKNPLCFNDECDGYETERIVSQTSFKLNGEGWYKDGYSKQSDSTKNLQAHSNDLRSQLNKTKQSLKEKAKAGK
jgi:putative FmdB family regulatory protein